MSRPMRVPSRRSLSRLSTGLLVAALAGLPLAAEAAGPYEFVAAPAVDLNRIYRIDRANGEVTSCQYGLRDDSVGVTLCFAAGEGAGPQTPGEYGLIASRHARESGIYRVNYRTGETSACYVQIRQELVVCTEQAGPPPAGTASGAGAAATGPAPGRAGPSATPPQGTRP
ncbi:hypothetical protein [Methylorubrum extorquens]|uniref:Uncharacterized protein n=5 Tax=Methylobacteriaceae TaxID=119045 RepID=B7L2C8_METC4|nr:MULTISPECIES: hypothetical protein [Methylobacteriaceae]KQO94800.1 hypothetical protein ASF33_11045 [Methylobacterium sp. Leaf92]KQP87438.1 hypothetical protein ASF55_06265 [Methylobacterium sp. Leaf119]ABY30692.1 hypothetical protein Mext_2297 [Methylorubrum extorquens PA1]ACK83413.1 conserved hypothetical protein [Methylorubrum extorquens CM4]KQQ01728.1 hypothetical protein ASF56_12895 [Methylobacterium sp. Leaf122]